MADSRVKKIVIPKSKLPAYSGENQAYIVRYRIVSEDKNRSSHWSPQYRLAIPSVNTIDYAIVIDSTGKVATTAWTPSSDTSNVFDIYVKWDSEAWQYAGSVSTNVYSAVIKPGTTSIKVAVQVPTFPKNRFASATLFETPTTSVVV